MAANDALDRFHTKFARVYARVLLLMGHEIFCDFDLELIILPLRLGEEGYDYVITIAFSDSQLSFCATPYVGDPASNANAEPCDALCTMIARINHERVNLGDFVHIVYDPRQRTWQAIATLFYESEMVNKLSGDVTAAVQNLLGTVICHTKRLADAARGYVDPADDLNGPPPEVAKRLFSAAREAYWKATARPGSERFKAICKQILRSRDKEKMFVPQVVADVGNCVKLRLDFENPEENGEYRLSSLRERLYDALRASSMRWNETTDSEAGDENDAADDDETDERRAEPRNEQEQQDQEYRQDDEIDGNKKEG